MTKTNEEENDGKYPLKMDVDKGVGVILAKDNYGQSPTGRKPLIPMTNVKAKEQWN